MKTRPTQTSGMPDYPNRRQFLKHIAGVVAAASLARALPVIADDEKTEEKKEPTAKVIARLASQLGDEDARKRKAATAALIKLGQTKDPAGKDSKPVREQVIAAMKKLSGNKDPEVSSRAKQIIVALQPKKQPPPPPDDQPILMGIMPQ